MLINSTNILCMTKWLPVCYLLALRWLYLLIYLLALSGSWRHFFFALCCARKLILECTWVTPSFPLSGSSLVQVDFLPQRLVRTVCFPDLLSLPPAGLNKTARVLFTEKVLKRVLFKLQKKEEKSRAKGTLLLSPSSRCCSLHPAGRRKLPLFALPLSGP